MEKRKSPSGSDNGKGREGAVVTSTPSSASQVVINIQTASSSPSPRLAHLRPPTPLTPEAMHRIQLLTVQEPQRFLTAATTDFTKPFSPTSPSTALASPTTSDLGSSRRSSVNVTTCPSSFTWSAYRQEKKSSSDFTDVDSDISKDLFSPSVTMSPAPFSPFPEHSPASYSMASESSMTRQRLHFSFDPKSPPFTPSTSSRFLLPLPPSSFGPRASRSWSESETGPEETMRQRSTSLTPTEEVEEKDIVEEGTSRCESGALLLPTKVDADKNVYKKRLLRKYEEEVHSPGETSGAGVGQLFSEIGAMSTEEQPSSSKTTQHITKELASPKSVALPLVRHQPSLPQVPRVLSRCSSSLPDYGRAYTGTLWPTDQPGSSFDPHQTQITIQPQLQSARLPLVRVEESTPVASPTEFGTWLSRPTVAVNPFWYQTGIGTGPMIGRGFGQRDIPVIRPFVIRFPTPHITSTPPFALPPPAPPLPPPIRHIFRPSPLYPTFPYGPFRPQLFPPSIPPFPFPQSTLAPPQCPLPFGRRSRSESDVSNECHLCGESFSLRDRLAKHMKTRHREQTGSAGSDSGVRAYRCNVCQKQFGRSDMLTRHMRLHTGIRPYVCNTCGQVFSRSDHLSTHLRTHTGEKPYQCPVCSYAASRRDMITRHMRTHSRIAETSDELSMSGIGQIPSIEETVDQSVLTEASTSKKSLSVEHLESLESAERSPAGSDSEHHSVSTGSTNTILYLESETDTGEHKEQEEQEEPKEGDQS